MTSLDGQLVWSNSLIPSTLPADHLMQEALWSIRLLVWRSSRQPEPRLTTLCQAATTGDDADIANKLTTSESDERFKTRR